MKEYNNIPKLQKAMAGDVTRLALTEAAKIVESAAGPLVPVDSGNLRGSITHRVDGDTVRIGTNVEYAPYIEFGTGQYAEGGKGRKTPWAYEHPKYGWVWTAGMSPKPYLRPALDDNIEAIKKTMKEKYGVEINKIAKEGGG
jgi:HK97 gp10 family phage protein